MEAHRCWVSSRRYSPQQVRFVGHDGDLVLVTDNEIMMKGVDRNVPVVIDIEDKVTALSELDTMENKFECIMRGLKSMIGEISNYATAYHNKMPIKESTKKEYENYIDLLSVLNGKAVSKIGRPIW